MLVSVCRAANVMKSTGHTVTLKVAKRAALHHGLGTLLDRPSPRMQQHSGMEPLSRCLVSLSAPPVLTSVGFSSFNTQQIEQYG